MGSFFHLDRSDHISFLQGNSRGDVMCTLLYHLDTVTSMRVDDPFSLTFTQVENTMRLGMLNFGKTTQAAE